MLLVARSLRAPLVPALLCLSACTFTSTGKPSPSPEVALAEARGVQATPEDKSDDKPKVTRRAPKPGDIPPPEDVAAPPADAEVTASGLASIVLTPGQGGDKPKYDPNMAARDAPSVRVHYTGWMKDGIMFDSSITRGQPATFRLGTVIDGWNEVLQLMTVGEKRRVWIPANLAYGETAERPGSPAGQLTFEIELLEIIPAAPAESSDEPAEE